MPAGIVQARNKMTTTDNDDNDTTTKKKNPEEIHVTLQRRRSTIPLEFIDPEDEAFAEHMSAIFRGIAAATRKGAMVAKKVAIAKGAATKQAVRAIGENRPLAFASEGAVAGDSMIPRFVYYGAWGLSMTAIAADIYTKYEDAPEKFKTNTAIYWTAFHIPASLIIPAAIIHQVVHATDKIVENPKGFAKSWPPRAKAMAPVVAALLSIIPVVPTVDYIAETVMEPTLGSYLGVEFHHHHHQNNDDDAVQSTPNKDKEA